MDLLVELKNKGALENEAGNTQFCSEEDTQVAKEIGKLNCNGLLGSNEKQLHYFQRVHLNSRRIFRFTKFPFKRFRVKRL